MANKYTAISFVTDTQAQCSKCKEIKPHSEFHQVSTNIHRKGCAYYCKTCACSNSRKNHKRRIEKDPSYKETKKSNYLKNRHGVSLQQYRDKLVQQGNSCAICGVELSAHDPNTHLDHDHKTGKLRDFLCGNCNRGIGSFHDDVDKMKKAIQYLNSHNSNVDTMKGGTPQ